MSIKYLPVIRSKESNELVGFLSVDDALFNTLRSTQARGQVYPVTSFSGVTNLVGVLEVRKRSQDNAMAWVLTLDTDDDLSYVVSCTDFILPDSGRSSSVSAWQETSIRGMYKHEVTYDQQRIAAYLPA